jgi:serine/threonine protein kinase
MALSPGDRLGAYEIVSAIGAGGMGEVYRGRDTRLDRDVAIKVLPDSFASDPDRIARFRREAKTLASLNHPHIGAIYGLEESNGIKALVLELVEGPTLADRIARGPIPVDEALAIAKQIAEALEAAHEHGIIHRDSKPANIKLRSDGTVKVLDFGLAKAVESSSFHPDLSVSPTITSLAMTIATPQAKTANDWSPDGRFILFQSNDPKTGIDLWLLPLEGKREPYIFLRTPFNERRATFSPDGRWVAYLSNESGQYEVYVRKFSDPGRSSKISNNGGNSTLLERRW